MHRIPLSASLLTIFCAVILSLGSNPLELRADEGRQPEVGKKAPDFELSTLDDKKHKLSELVKEGPVVVIMLRGYPTYQCPLCSRQMAAFINASQDFNKRDTTVVFIYPDNANGVAQHSQEFIQGKKFPKNCLFLLDPDFKFTNSYGLRWDEERETAYPATFIIDQDQMVKSSKITRSHGGRTNPKDVLKELK